MKPPFRINHLDHVAILVKDMEISAAWYEQILGLSKISPEEWNGVPVMMFAGSSGVAIFPLKDARPADVKFVDHFAFNIDAKKILSAQNYLSEKGIAHEFKDHIYYHSIYFKDPDGHTVELTAQVSN